jgi:NADH-quinone oxidoreductase subunit E
MSAAADDGAPDDDAFRAELRELTTRYPAKRGALLPILTAMQERRGHLEPEDLKLAGELVGISGAEVYSVVTFYTMFRLHPAGRFPIGVCRNISCWLSGSEQVVATLQQELGIAPGQKTADGAFSVGEVECLGSCGSGPCLEVESRYFENLTPANVRELVARLKSSRETPARAIAAAQAEHASKHHGKPAATAGKGGPA